MGFTMVGRGCRSANTGIWLELKNITCDGLARDKRANDATWQGSKNIELRHDAEIVPMAPFAPMGTSLDQLLRIAIMDRLQFRDGQATQLGRKFEQRGFPDSLALQRTANR